MPFGHAYASELDAEGRKRIVEVPEAQQLIRRIVDMHAAGKTPCAIARQFHKENLPGPRRGQWSTNSVMRVLVRQGRTVRRRPQTKRRPRVWDRERAMEIAATGRAQGLSLRSIESMLEEARLAPLRGGKWHAATVLTLLDAIPTPGQPDARSRAQWLRTQGLSMRAVGRQFWNEGYRPEREATWHNQTVADLLATS